MAYGLKYIATAYGLSSSQWKLEIYEKDFTPIEGSSPISLSLSGDGIKIGYDREEDRFNTIYSRYAIIDLKVTGSFDLDTLQFDDERKFLVKIYRGNTFEFSGWIIPNYSSQDYEDVSIVTISIQAKDSINRLKDIPFVDEYPISFSHKQSVKSLISQSLRNIGYNLDLEIYYNKYEDGMLKTSSDCPLSQLYVNVRSFKEKDTWISYYDVIQRLLSDHDLRIFQANGKWIILSPIELVDGSVSGRKFNYLGTYQSNVTLSSDLSLGLSGLGIRKSSVIRKGIPIQSFTANFEFGQSRNLVLNGGLENFSDFQPEGWTLSNNWVNGEVAENTGGGIIFRNTYATRSSSILPDVPVNDASLNQNKYLESDQINIERLGTFSLSAETFISEGIDAARVRIEFYDEGGVNKQYITSDGKLTFVPTSLYVYNNGTNSYKLLTLTWNNKNQYGTPIGFKYMKVKIYEGIRLRSGTPETTEVKFKNINISGRPIDVSGEFIGKRIEIKNTQLLNSKKYSDVVFYYKDVELFNEPEHVHKLYLNDSIGETSISSGKWKRTTESTQRKLIDSRLVDRLSMSNRFGDIFEGSIFGYVGMNTTPYLEIDEKRLLVLYSEFSLGNNTSEIVAIELFANNFTLEKKEYNLFSDETIIEVNSDSASTTKINVGEKFEPITNAGGTVYGGLYADKGIDSLPANTTDPRATNKGLLTLGPINAQNIELGNRENNTLVEILGRLGIRNTNNFLGEFSVANLTANRVATLPDRNIEINKWSDLSGVPTSFTPAAHSHTIGDIIGLGVALDGKQPLNGGLTSLSNLSTIGIVRRSGANTFVIGTNDPITLSGDISGTGTTAITATLSNTGVAAGTYQSVTVDTKGRVTAGSILNNIVGTTNYIPKFTSSSTIGNSIIFDDGTNVGIGTIPQSKFEVNNTSNSITGDFYANSVLGNSYGVRVYAGTNSSDFNLRLRDRLDTQDFLYVRGDGKIAVGGNFANSKVDIYNTSGQYDSNLTLRNSAHATSKRASMFIGDTVASYQVGVDFNANGTNDFFIFDNINYATKFLINNNGIGILTNNPLFGLDVNGTGRFIGSVQFDSIATCLVPPTSPNHLTNKAYVDSLSFIKKGDNVKTISLTNVALNGTQTINSVSLIAGDLILVAGQTTAAENGVYIVASGSWTRSTTNDSDSEIRGAYHLITAGTYINQRYINTNSSTITVGTTAITYTLDFGQESDPVWAAFQSSNDITPTRIGNWNTAYDSLQTFVKKSGDTMTGQLNLANSVRVGGTGSTHNNTYLGKDTLISRTTGTGNTCIGSNSFASVTTGSNNIALGMNSGGGLTTGSYNVFLGTNVSSDITTGSNNVVIGGRIYGLSSSLSNNIIIADGAGNRRINVNSSGFVGFGLTNAAYQVDVNGDINTTGMFRLNGSFGSNHQFLKSNGTTQEWASINVSEISDIDTYYVSKNYADANYIKRVTDDGERGFFMYGDVDNTIKEGFLFTNPDTGIMGIHAFRLNGTNIEQYGFQLDKDGLPYWLFTDGSRKRILTENDSVGGGSITYTLAEPLYFSGTQINIRTASNTQTGVLTSAKFNDFDAKFGEGSTVNTFLNFANGKPLTFSRDTSNVGLADATISVYDSNYTLLIQSKNAIEISALDTIKLQVSYFGGGSTMFTEVEMGKSLSNSILKFNGTNFNFKTNTTPTNGQKFVVQYDSSKNTFFFVPM